MVGGWTSASFFCDGAGGLASLAICHNKTDSPPTNHESPGLFGKAQRKRKETHVCFFICMQIYFIVSQIIKFHRHSRVYSENFHTHAIKMNVHDQNIFRAWQKNCLHKNRIVAQSNLKKHTLEQKSMHIFGINILLRIG